MELTLSEGEETRGNKINGGGHNAAAAKRNNDTEVLRGSNCTSEDFYYLPQKFKNLAKPLLATCKTCRPGTSVEVLNCFYTARTGWSFILPAERPELNLSSSLPFSSLTLTLFPLCSYFPLYLISLLLSLLTFISRLKKSIFLSFLLPLWLLSKPNFPCSQFTPFPISQTNIIFENLLFY